MGLGGIGEEGESVFHVFSIIGKVNVLRSHLFIL